MVKTKRRGIVNLNNGGILAYVKDNIKTLIIKTYTEEKFGQQLWILIDNKNIRMKLGIRYAPQENTTLNKNLKIIYSAIKQQIKQAKQQNQNIQIVANFNAKIWKRIKTKKETVTRQIRQLIK